MFKSTVMKLTGWYVILLIVINGTLAILYFQISIENTRHRLDDFYAVMVENFERYGVKGMTDELYNELHADYIDRASNALMVRLSLYILAILVLSGVVSYILSRFTLKPVEESHQTQKRFASDVSHELSTPLAAMKSEIEVTLRDKNASQEQLRSALQSSLEEVETLSSVTESMLMMSRLDHAKELVKQDIDLKLTVLEAMYRFRDYNTRLKITGKSGIIIHANESIIIELFSILIDNALKYSPLESQIKIRVYKKGANSFFEITNGGNGISINDQKHIFDRFYRADSSRTHGVQDSGTGLGLAIAKQIALLHKAHISVVSRESRKTTFTVAF